MRLRGGRGSLLRSLSKEPDCNNICYFTPSLNYLAKTQIYRHLLTTDLIKQSGSWRERIQEKVREKATPTRPPHLYVLNYYENTLQACTNTLPHKFKIMCRICCTKFILRRGTLYYKDTIINPLKEEPLNIV